MNFRVLFLLFFLFTPSFLFAAFECPMHCEGKKTYEHAQKCPVCGMDLESQTGTSAPYALNSSDYAIDFVTHPKTLRPGEVMEIKLLPKHSKDASPVRDLEETWRSPLSVFVVGPGLTGLELVHAKPAQPSGFSLSWTPRSSGKFLLWARFTPRGKHPQTFPWSVTLDGPAATVKEPTSPKLRAVTGSLKSGQRQRLEFEVSQAGKPVAPLVTQSEDLGFSVALHENQSTWIEATPSPEPSSKPGRVAYEAVFPKPGKYRFWVEVLKAGQPMRLSTWVVAR